MRIAPLLALALVAGCGYRTGLTVPEGDGDVAVALFDNDGKLRDLERDLHAEIGMALERLVDARLTSPERADWIVRGRIVEYTRRGGIRSLDNRLLETGVNVAVEARLVRAARPGPAVPAPVAAEEGAGGEAVPGADEAEPERDGAKVVARTRVSSQSGFRLDEPNGELRARERVLRSLADRIVLDLFAPVAYEPAPAPSERP